jgi:hypothetical protein
MIMLMIPGASMALGDSENESWILYSGLLSSGIVM